MGTKGIDLSRVDRILTGQLSKRFVVAKEQPGAPEILDREATSLTIVFRAVKAGASTYVDSFTYSGNNSPGVTGGSSSVKNSIFAGWEYLDLCVADPSQYAKLVTALEHLIKVYREERRWLERSVLVLQYHWVDMGKLSINNNLSSNEWIDLCNRLNTPLKRQDALALFRDMKNELKRACKELGTNMDLDVGLPAWAVAELIKDLQFHSATVSGIRLVKQDPMTRLWNEIVESDPVPILNKDGAKVKVDTKIAATTPDTSISSVAFLSFIRSQQKEFKATLDDALALMKALKAQKSSKQLAGDEDQHKQPPRNSDSNGNGTSGNGIGINSMDNDDRLSKGHFFNFLLSDANDLMDPRKGKVGADDMSHPLSSYWIMSSHDTYMNCGDRELPVLDDQMYLAALYRGVRCLEIDVWDGAIDSNFLGEPVIAREKPKTAEDPVVGVQMALRAIRQFLLANKSYPVILNIENHCSYAAQEKLADYLFQILGSIGLIVVPDDSQSIDESDLLPSPASMRGKVLLMGKRPKIIKEGAKVVNDDYDDENDVFVDDSLPNVKSREEEHELENGIVTGFDTKGPIRALDEKEQKNVVKHSPGELLYIAKQELETAELGAAQAQIQAQAAVEEAKKADKFADSHIRNAGLSEEAVEELLSQIKGVEIDPDEHVALLSRSQGEGVEVQDFFADAVKSAKLTFAEADQVALEAAEKAAVALQKLNAATVKLREAEVLLEQSYHKGKKVVDKFQMAAKVARDKQEIADHATRRVEKLRQLLKECENGASSAQNVVNTAMTEAKISEKRAGETEARAARAAATAQKDRLRAEEESRKEEELERQAAALHEQMVDATNAEKEAKDQAAKAAAMLDRINEQIKLIETSSQYLREQQETSDSGSEEKKESKVAKGGKLHIKLATKLEERRECTESIRQSSVEIGILAKRRLMIQEAFEEKAHNWKSQAEVASRLRKVSDKSSHAAEDLAEHAEEEREAANLRRVARDRAKSHVTEKDSYKQGLRAQLAEAEKAKSLADADASKARNDADRLAMANDSVEKNGHEDILAATERRKAIRDDLLADYEKKMKAKEEAEERAAESKKMYETSDQVFSDAMRIAQTDQKRIDLQKRHDRNALVAVNSARLARKQAAHLLEQARYAESVVTEKQCILKRAEEYKEKTDRISEIPTNLAKMTFLHTTKHRYWEKSLHLPSTHVHSFAEGVLDQMAKKDGQEHTKNLKKFTASHLCRSFPSWKDLDDASQLNSDPLFQWSLGCQLVSLNYGTYGEELFKADGRFRRNGSCGYVLKPESLRAYDGIPERSETWKMQVLCGSFIPAPESKQDSTTMTYVDPFVKINVYGGDLEQRKGEYKTKVVERNGLNPVFDDKTGFVFKATNPSLAILTFTVLDRTDCGKDEFIGGAAMPVSCVREGFRSVQLFDKQHTRAGPHAYASLLVKAEKIS
jgi:Phosphatidylinositol-specific phospholipase C, X domain/Phosphatidylinositol-specific phospholipase C, Y domain/C2 domain